MSNRTNLSTPANTAVSIRPNPWPTVRWPFTPALRTCTPLAFRTWESTRGVGERRSRPGLPGSSRRQLTGCQFCHQGDGSAVVLLALMCMRLGRNVLDVSINESCCRQRNRAAATGAAATGPGATRCVATEGGRECMAAGTWATGGRQRRVGPRRARGRRPISMGRRLPSGREHDDVNATTGATGPTLARPTRLRLRTGTHHRRSGNTATVKDEEDDDDEWADPICLAALGDGDRVGVLPCQHCGMMYSNQTWLKRKNACPLCQAIQIATPG